MHSIWLPLFVSEIQQMMSLRFHAVRISIKGRKFAKSCENIEQYWEMFSDPNLIVRFHVISARALITEGHQNMLFAKSVKWAPFAPVSAY